MRERQHWSPPSKNQTGETENVEEKSWRSSITAHRQQLIGKTERQRIGRGSTKENDRNDNIDNIDDGFHKGLNARKEKEQIDIKLQEQNKPVYQSIFSYCINT